MEMEKCKWETHSLKYGEDTREDFVVVVVVVV